MYVSYITTQLKASAYLRSEGKPPTSKGGLGEDSLNSVVCPADNKPLGIEHPSTKKVELQISDTNELMVVNQKAPGKRN